MTAHEASSSPPAANRRLHVVFGAGGSRAILGGAGAVVAFDVLGLKQWVSVAGCSGGSIPAMLLAGEYKPAEVLRLVINTDFASRLVPKTGYLRRLLALLMKFRHEKNLPPQGCYSWRKLQELVDEAIPAWPKTFWTVAICEHGQVVFTADGVVKYTASERHAISAPPLSVGLAVCATCAVPGIIDAVPFGGEHLFDGALSIDGQCPVEIIRRHFGDELSNVVAFDVGDEDIKQSRWLRLLWNIFCGGSCGNIESKHPEEKDGLVLVKPQINSFHGLQFDISRNLKWEAVVAGFTATVRRLQASTLVGASELERALKVLGELEDARHQHGNRVSLSNEVERVLRAHGLF